MPAGRGGPKAAMVPGRLLSVAVSQPGRLRESPFCENYGVPWALEIPLKSNKPYGERLGTLSRLAEKRKMTVGAGCSAQTQHQAVLPSEIEDQREWLAAGCGECRNRARCFRMAAGSHHQPGEKQSGVVGKEEERGRFSRPASHPADDRCGGQDGGIKGHRTAQIEIDLLPEHHRQRAQFKPDPPQGGAGRIGSEQERRCSLPCQNEKNESREGKKQ